MRALAAGPRVLTPLALIATVFGLVLPSGALAARSDLLLALLVLATALGISFADLRRLREHLRAVVTLALTPLPALVGPVAIGWLSGSDVHVGSAHLLGRFALVVLVYAALSGTHGAHHLGGALLASVGFLIVCACLAGLWRRLDGGRTSAILGAFTIAMRDFAVAAALATQAFGTAAGAVPGVYGVVMLVAATVAAGRLSHA